MRSRHFVLLVEVKAARPIQAARLGDPSSDDDIDKKIGQATAQITKSAGLIETQAQLAHINPEHLPVFGLVVTLEPFHLINTPLYGDVLREASIPTMVVSAHELEGFVAAVESLSDPDPYLLAAFNPPDDLAPRSLAVAVRDLERSPNPLLARSWDRFMKPIEDLDVASQTKTDL